MNFLAPLAAAFAALSIPIVLLYMLRLRRTEMRISSNFLWRDLVRDREANAPWQKLRFSWLLLLQLLILALFVLALMRPVIEVETISDGRIVVLLDASASMNAVDVDDTRFSAAQTATLEVVDTLGGDDTMTVIRVADVPQVLITSSDDETDLRAAIRRAEPGTGAADWSAALTLAAAGGRGVEDLDVVIVSDGGLPPGLPDVPGDLRLLPIGQERENLAITALSVREIPGEGAQLFAQLRNFGGQDAEVIFDIELDGELFSAQRYDLPAGERADIVVEDLPADFQTLQAGLNAPAASAVPDYLPDDDNAYAVRALRGAGDVLLVTERNIFLSQIFNSIPGMDVTQAAPSAGLPSGTFDLYIFDQWLPENLPDADMFIVAPTTNTPLFDVGGTVEDINQAAVTTVAEENPITAFLDFDDVNIRAFQQLSGYDGWAQTLIQAQGGPLLLAGEIGNNQVAILTFALQDSDLPLQLAYPILISNLAQWYTPPSALQLTGSLAPGDTVSIRALTGTQARVTLPDDETLTLFFEGERGEIIFADTTQPGVYQVEVLDGDTRITREFFAVNLFNAQESAIAPAESVTVGTTTITEATREETGERELWPFLLWAGLALLLFEWLYYHRGSLRERLTRWRNPRARPRAERPRSMRGTIR
ncbi:MAG: VWA domain-containing protein [Anaerolineales bacterium]